MTNSRSRRLARTAAFLSPLGLVLGIVTSAWAIAFTLGGPNPDGAGLDSDTTSALYATGRDGTVQLIAQVGAIAPGGGIFTDLGVPSIASDGAVVFGGETEGQDMRPQWDIYRAMPGAPATRRIVAVLDGASISDGCRPALKSDPYPVAGENGAVAFLAPEASGHDAVFRYLDGKLSCVARVGDRTAQGHVLKMLYFGSADIAPDGQLAFLARLRGDSQNLAERTAVVLADEHSTIQEIARDGDLAPGGEHLGPSFGRPTIRPTQHGNVVAFINRNNSIATAYLSRAGHLSASLRTGAHTSIGALTFISDGRPALLPDGTMIVSGACKSRSGVFMAKDGAVTLIKREGDRTPFGTRMEAFVDPTVTPAGLVFLGGHDDTGRNRLFVFPSHETRVRASNFEASDFRRWTPEFFPGSLAVNQRGDLVFLGASIDPDPARARIVHMYSPFQ